MLSLPVPSTQKLVQKGILVLDSSSRPVLDSRQHIGIEGVIADIMRGAATLGLVVSVFAAHKVGILTFGAALDAVAHSQPTIGALQKAGENLCSFALTLPTAAGDLLLYGLKNIRRDNRLVGSLNPQALFIWGTNHPLVLVGHGSPSVVDSVADVGLVLQNIPEIWLGPHIPLFFRLAFKISGAASVTIAAYEAVDAMNAFFEKAKHPKQTKYKNDYSNKYRYALTAILCAAYRKDKSYYGFNTICYLSEGNTRTFINLCRAIISDALFYEKASFISTGRISAESQSRAIKDYSLSEFESVCSIIQHGNNIRNFILSLGNVFSEYHKDRMVRYPETNQFSYNPDSLLSTDKDILNIAISWSLIKRRKGTQRISASIAKEDFLYSINKIFSPMFNISYRTRGGVNVVLFPDDVGAMLKGEPIRSFISSSGQKKGNSANLSKKAPPYEQVSMFDEEES